MDSLVAIHAIHRGMYAGFDIRPSLFSCFLYNSYFVFFYQQPPPEQMSTAPGLSGWRISTSLSSGQEASTDEPVESQQPLVAFRLIHIAYKT